MYSISQDFFGPGRNLFFTTEIGGTKPVKGTDFSPQRTQRTQRREMDAGLMSRQRGAVGSGEIGDCGRRGRKARSAGLAGGKGGGGGIRQLVEKQDAVDLAANKTRLNPDFISEQSVHPESPV